MLFNVDNDFLFKEYFNINKRKETNILSPKEGLMIGNMYANEYVPYKNYVPKELTATSKEGQLKLKIMELCFAVNDLSLKLDLNPNDYECYHLFKQYVSKLNECTEMYAEEFGPLELCDDLKGEYSWYKSPWPWEGDSHVQI